MTARDGAVSVCDKFGRPIPPIDPGQPPAAGGFWATIPSFGQEVRVMAVIFAIAGLVLLVARS